MIDPKRARWKPVAGDDFVLCRFDVVRGPHVLDSSADLRAVMGAVVEHLLDQRLSVLRVTRWGQNPSDSTDSEPVEYETIMEIEPYAVELMGSDPDEAEAIKSARHAG